MMNNSHFFFLYWCEMENSLLAPCSRIVNLVHISSLASDWMNDLNPWIREFYRKEFDLLVRGLFIRLSHLHDQLGHPRLHYFLRKLTKPQKSPSQRYAIAIQLSTSLVLDPTFKITCHLCLESKERSFWNVHLILPLVFHGPMLSPLAEIPKKQEG